MHSDEGRPAATIQALSPDDWQVWRALRLEALAEAPAAFGTTLAEWTGEGDKESRWRERLTDVPFNAVIHDGGEAVGMVSAYIGTDDCVELISLWIAPQARGRGIGDLAIRTVIDWAGNHVVKLAVKTGNAAAIALYRRHGFRDVGLSESDPTETIMRRR